MGIRDRAERLTHLAEAARAKGATMRSSVAKRAMLKISNKYAWLAKTWDALADRCAKLDKERR